VFVLVPVMVVVWQKFGSVRFTVIVIMVVDDDRDPAVGDHSATECLGEQGGPENFIGGSVREHTARHQDHPVGAPCLGQVMGGEDHHAASGRVPFDDFDDTELARQIETGDRFVEQQDVRFGRHRLGDEHALLLAAGEIAKRPSTQVAHLELVGGTIDRVAIFGAQTAQQAPHLVSPHAEHLVDRQRHPAMVFVMLRDHCHPTCHVDGPVGGLDEPREQGQQCGLAAPVRAHERDIRATFELERCRRERDNICIVHTHIVECGEMICRDCCHGNDSHSNLLRVILTRRARLDIAGIAATIVLSGTLAACDGSDGATADADLVATTDIWADITSRVACGDDVTAVIPSGADLHTYEPSLRDREQMEHADLIVANGAGLEAGLADLIDVVGADTDVIEVADHVDLIIPDDDEDDNDGHAADPHIWLDPMRVSDALPTISSALETSGRDPARLDECIDDYRSEVARVDVVIVDLLADIPAERRILVTNHDSLAYFADRYDFEIVGTVIPSTSTLAESSANELAELADVIETRDVPAIFTERGESDIDAAALAARLDDVDVVELSFASLDDGAASSYTGMMIENAELIAAALEMP